MNLIYQSKHFSPEKVVSTYARLYSNGEVKFFDVNLQHKTIRERWMTIDHVDAETCVKLRCNEQVLVSGLTMQERDDAIRRG